MGLAEGATWEHALRSISRQTDCRLSCRSVAVLQRCRESQLVAHEVVEECETLIMDSNFTDRFSAPYSHTGDPWLDRDSHALFQSQAELKPSVFRNA